MARNFSDFITAYLKYTEHHESVQSIHRWTAISIIAGALERRCWLDRGHYTLFPNLYVLVVAPAGLMKKSTSTGIGVDLLRRLPGIKIMSERVTAASLIQQLRDAKKTFKIGNKNVAQSPVFSYASEFLVFAKEVHGSIHDLLTTFFDCIPNDSKIPWTYRTKTDGDMKIYGPCLNFLGATTKTWLEQAIPAEHMSGGFASRILFLWEDRVPDNIVPWPKLPPDGQTYRKKLVEDLRAIGRMQGEFKVDDLFIEKFAAFYHDHVKMVAFPNQDPRISGYLGRKGDFLLKLSLIKSASEGDSLRLRYDHLKWAYHYLNDLEDKMFSGFGVDVGAAHAITAIRRAKARQALKTA